MRVGLLGTLEVLDDGGGELVGVGAGRVELAQQRERLTAEGVFDQWGLVQVLGAQYRLESVGFGVDTALAAGAAQQRPQLGLGQLRGRTCRVPERGHGAWPAVSGCRLVLVDACMCVKRPPGCWWWVSCWR